MAYLRSSASLRLDGGDGGGEGGLSGDGLEGGVLAQQVKLLIQPLQTQTVDVEVLVHLHTATGGVGNG